MWRSIAPTKSCSASSRRRRISVWAARIVSASRAWARAAELEALAREPLGVLDAARHLRPHDLPADGEVAVERLAQLGGERGEAAVGGAGLVHARGLEQVVDAPVVAERLELGLAELRREREQLLAQAQALVDVVDVHAARAWRDSSATTRPRGSPSRCGHRERLLAEPQRGAPAAPANCSRSTRRARSWTASRWSSAKRAERLLEQRDALVVDHARLGVAAGEAERGLGERVAVAAVAGASAAAANVARAAGRRRAARPRRA